MLQRRKLVFNNPVSMDKQKAPSANYIFNQHLSKLLTDNEKAEFNFQEMDKDEKLIDPRTVEKRSKSVMQRP